MGWIFAVSRSWVFCDMYRCSHEKPPTLWVLRLLNRIPHRASKCRGFGLGKVDPPINHAQARGYKIQESLDLVC